MSFSIVVPKKKIYKGKRDGGGADFWKTFWEKKVNDDNREHYTKMFTSRVKQIDKTVKKIKRTKDTNKLMYVEIKLDELSTSKTSSPNEVWNETGLEIVSAVDENTIVVSGKPDDFDRLSHIGTSGNFDAALTGKGLKRRKDKNLLREVYAMSAVNDRNTVVEGRMSNHLYSLVNDNKLDHVVDCIIEIYSNIGKEKYDSLFDSLSENPIFQNKIKKRNTNLFFSNVSFLAPLKIKDILNILSNEDFNFISKIKEEPILSSQRCIPDINLGNLNLLPPLTGEKVGIIDGGIYNSTLRQLRAHHHNYLSRHNTEDEHHGSTVASRILFGDDFFLQLSSGGTIAPACNMLDIQVLYLDGPNSRCIPLEDLKNAISEVVNRYTDVSIYNLSISEGEPIEDDDISELTEFFDNMARTYDVIFVCSVGNHNVYALEDYNDIFKQRESIIASPSDALNVISVGAISSNVDANCVNCTEGFPSPFTRTSGIKKNMKKPELVANGGNVKKDATNGYNDNHMVASSKLYGVESINKDGLYKDIGTSLSTPLITRECAFILDYIKKANASQYIELDNNKLNLVKALLIHSTTKAQQVKVDDDYIKRAFGFGVPNHEAVLRDEENELTLMYADKINFEDKKHKLQIKLPDNLIDKKVEFIFTLTYNPPVDKNYPKTYKMMSIEPALRLLVPTMEDGVIKDKPISLNQAATWDRYRNHNHNVVHFKRVRGKMNSSVLEVLMQLTSTQSYESKILGRESEIDQPYAFVLTIRDLSGYDKFREEVISVNEYQELVQIESEEQVEV